jgi:signal transduction histidine kinase
MTPEIPSAETTTAEVMNASDPELELNRLRKRLARERAARAEVEHIAETKMRELYEHQQELSTLEQVASAVNAAQTVDAAFQVAVTQICRFARWPVGHVTLHRDSGSAASRIWHLEDPEALGSFVSAADGLSGTDRPKLTERVIERRAAIWVDDFSAEDRFLGAEAARAVGLHAAAAAPVWVGEEIVGVFVFFSYRAAPSDQRLLALITQAGIQLGRAVERERARTVLLDQQEELERLVAERTASLTVANRELASFAYSVSHDLRAPLRAIHGFSQALDEDYGEKLDAEGVGYLARVRAATERMGELIDGMLLLAQVTRDELSRTNVDLSTLAAEVVAELHAGDPDREVDIEIAAGLAAAGDRRMLRLVLQNLIGNAWKFTRHTEAAQIRVELGEGAGEQVFVVSDNGAGFDPTYAGKLFGAFQRLHAAAEFEGTGIGLATVQRIVQRHGGRIWAEGTPGAGAKFRFTLAPEEASA